MRDSNKAAITLAAIVGFVSVGMAALMTTSYVDEHHVGVRIVSGGVSDRVIDGGWTLRNPFTQRIEHIPHTVQDMEITDRSAATRDNYAVEESVISVSYRIDPDRAHELYREMPDFVNRIHSEAADAFSEAIGQYEVAEIPNRRRDIGDHIMQALIDQIGDDVPITILSAYPSSYEWDDNARDTIRQQQRAELEREEARQERETSRIRSERELENERAEAERRALRAESETAVTLEEAEADAEAVRLRADAESERLRMIAEAVSDTPEILGYERIEKWDGRLPLFGSVSSDAQMRMDVDPSMLE